MYDSDACGVESCEAASESSGMRCGKSVRCDVCGVYVSMRGGKCRESVCSLVGGGVYAEYTGVWSWV